MQILLYILNVIGLWKMFEKAGIDGWKAIVPIYNTYNVVKMVNRPISYFWWMTVPAILMFVSIPFWGVTALSTSLVEGSAAGVGGALNSFFLIMVGIFAFLMVVVSIPIMVIVAHDTAKSFGKGIWMTLGLIFFPFICNLILGFGDASYHKIHREHK